MADSGWPKSIGGRKKKTRNNRNEVGRGMEKVMKQQKVLTLEEAVNRQIWPNESENQLTGIEVHPITGHEGPEVE